MSKDAYYFSHDSNARNDEKIVDLRFSHGWEGYGIYWAIIEMLRDAESYQMQIDCKRIAFALQADEQIIRSVIFDFDLFVFGDEHFWSESLKRRMELRGKVSDQRRKAARKRWDNAKADANALQTECNSNAIKGKERKGKETKLKESKAKYSESFEQFWSAYPNKKAKRSAQKAWDKATDKPGIVGLIAIIEVQKRSEQWIKGFIPHPATWLNGGCWEDEDVDTQQIPRSKMTATQKSNADFERIDRELKEKFSGRDPYTDFVKDNPGRILDVPNATRAGRAMVAKDERD